MPADADDGTSSLHELGVVRYLDALELESIVWAPDQWMRALLDPSQHRWRDAEPGPPQESLRNDGPTRTSP
jgi:hypothetical protein